MRTQRLSGLAKSAGRAVATGLCMAVLSTHLLGSAAAAAEEAGARDKAPLLAPTANRLQSEQTAGLVESVERLETDDGWSLAIHRVAPTTAVWHQPILMIHGLCSNYATWDLNETQSIQRFMASRGFDTWALDLRGAGDSDRPAPGRYLNWNYSIDDFIHYDAPAALEHVLARTGAQKAFVMGHSMGGLITYGMLGTHPELQNRVQGIVTLAGAGLMGSDGSGENPASQAILSLAGLVAPFVIDNMVVPTEAMAQAGSSIPGASFFLEALAKWVAIWIWNPRNVTVDLIDQMAAKAVGNTNTNILQQFAVFSRVYDTFSFGGRIGYSEASDYYKANGEVSYYQSLAAIKVPALVAAGSADRLVAAHNIQSVWQKLGSFDKVYVEYGRSHGTEYDYGHVDLVMGKNAHLEVYPELYDWLEVHAN